jgi:hypothetical protein
VKEAGRRGYRGRDDRGARTRTDRHPVRNTHTYVCYTGVGHVRQLC